ncbi:MAG TPA: nucleotide sugar dehydrogenase [Candidatus Paceibacterota bacterium]|nr:nucleotide sugar dehydrogenase [Candidatus Paceibacterota bacterium]
MLKKQNKSKTIAVVGLGYVGLPLALLAEKTYTVIGIDTKREKVEKINARIAPFADEALQKELSGAKKFSATTAFSSAAAVKIIIICVPTPVTVEKMPNYEPVESACRELGKYLQRGQLVILESTVNPGVCEELVIPILEQVSGLKAGTDFSVAHCPERINPGDAAWNVSNIPRVVGGFDKRSLKRAVAFYRSILSAEVRPMGSLKEAEAVKIVENSFRNVNIAFVNELAKSFSKMGVDVVNVINGAATKPFAFMAHYPGCGIGGHCIPVDPYYLIAYARKYNGFEHKFLSLACEVNAGMPQYTVDILEKALREKNISIDGATVAVLGLAYKADIDDCRESPSFAIIEELQRRGARVTAYDPHVPKCSDVETLDAALTGKDAVIVAVNHTKFRRLSPNTLKGFGVQVVVDGKNCLPKEQYIQAGLSYQGIGR